MKKLVPLLILFIISFPLHAGRTYTFDELRATLTYGNMELRRQDEVIRNARLDRAEAIGAYTPTIKFSAMGFYMSDPILNDFTLDLSDYITGFPSTPINLFDMEHDIYLFNLSFTQPIITGGKITSAYLMLDDVLSLRTLERKDKENSLSTELEGYLASLYYLMNISSRMSMVDELSGELLAMAESSYENGMSTEIEYLSQKIKSEEIGYSLKELEASIENLVSSVSSMTGVKDITSNSFSFTPDEERYRKIYEKGEDELLALSLSPARDSIRMLDGAIAVADRLKGLRLGSMYGVPDIALMVSLTYGGDKFPFFERNWLSDNKFSVNVGLSLSTTLWDGGKILNDVKRAESQKESALIDKEDAIRTISSKVREEWRNMDISYARLDYIEEKGNLLVREKEELEGKVESGYASRIDLLQKEIEILQNEIEGERKKIAIAASALTLEYLSGLKGLEI